MKKHNLNNLYFEDYRMTLPVAERTALLSFARIFWYSIFAVGVIFVLIGLNHSLRVPPPIISVVTGKSIFFSLFWFGLFLFLYSFHHLSKSRHSKLNMREIAFEEKLATQKFNLADIITPDTKQLLTALLDQIKTTRVSIDALLFSAIATTPLFKNIFDHLEANSQKIIDCFEIQKKEFPPYKTIELGLEDFELLLKESFENARILDDEAIDQTHLLISVLRRQQKIFNDIFLAENIDYGDIRNVLLLQKLKRKYSYLIYKEKPRKIQHRYMDLAMTAKPTYFLDRFSYDMTDLARYGLVGFMIGHRAETEEIINILNLDAKNNALMIGPAGVGKTTIIENIAYRTMRNLLPPKLNDRRVVALDTGGILGGLRAPGELQERLGKIRDEIIAAKNLILVIPDIHDLIKATSMQAASLSSFFGPIFQATDFPIIATTDEKNYHAYLEPDAEIVNAFNQIKIKEMSPDDALYLLMIESFKIEAKKQTVVSYYALKDIIDISNKYMHNQQLPGKAVSLLYSTVENVLAGGHRLITRESVREAFTKRTGIPLTQTKEQEKKLLLELETVLHQRMIDQQEAVTAVAETLREARTGLSREAGPIGVFLFVGPTGVGKTELAKTLASYYFKGEEHMLRFDMSEYQTNDAIYRLIGYKGQGGFMTEAVKQHPFSLVLLDEFEKANRDVVNLFLQVFDDGRLTDELGNIVDFTNTIIIATSNAHSVLIKEQLETGATLEEIKQLLKVKLTDYFKPELINRFDDIIVFKPLAPEDIRKIALLQIGRLFWQLENDKGFKFKISNEALNKIVAVGFDPVYGGRPLRQAIRKKIKNLISLLILNDKLERGHHYTLDFTNDKDFFVVDAQTTALFSLNTLKAKTAAPVK